MYWLEHQNYSGNKHKSTHISQSSQWSYFSDQLKISIIHFRFFFLIFQWLCSYELTWQHYAWMKLKQIGKSIYNENAISTAVHWIFFNCFSLITCLSWWLKMWDETGSWPCTAVYLNEKNLKIMFTQFNCTSSQVSWIYRCSIFSTMWETRIEVF